MDALSAILKSVRLETAVFREGAQPRMNNKRALIMYAVTEGRAQLRVDGGESAELKAGDLALIVHGHAHRLTQGKVIEGVFDASEELTRMMLGALPPVVKARIGGDEVGRSLLRSLQALVRDSKPGREAVLARFAESLVAEALRRVLEERTPGQAGWIAAFQDAETGKALAAMHADPAHRWTIAALAQKAGTSRSVLAERFRQNLGEAPIGYLAKLRLNLGAERLLRPGAAVADVAREVGYESEQAFNRAFKRAFGVPPARYRRQRYGSAYTHARNTEGR